MLYHPTNKCKFLLDSFFFFFFSDLVTIFFVFAVGVVALWLLHCGTYCGLTRPLCMHLLDLSPYEKQPTVVSVSCRVTHYPSIFFLTSEEVKQLKNFGRSCVGCGVELFPPMQLHQHHTTAAETTTRNQTQLQGGRTVTVRHSIGPNVTTVTDGGGY